MRINTISYFTTKKPLENISKGLALEVVNKIAQSYHVRRLRNATPRINTGYFLLQNKTTPHWSMVNQSVLPLTP